MLDELKVDVLSRKPITFAGDASGKEKFFQLEQWRVRIGDIEDDRILWKRGGFVLVVAVTQDREIVCIREYKQAVEQILVCLPAGSIKKSESPVQAALRELTEETGYGSFPENCLVLGPFFNSPDKSTEQHFVVIVENVVKISEPRPERSETILGVELLHHSVALKRVKIGMHLLALQLLNE